MAMIEQWHLCVFDSEWPPANLARFIFPKHSIPVSTKAAAGHTPTQLSRPSHVIFHGQGTGDAHLTEIGVVWSHAKGGGFNLCIKVLPMVRDA